jgi:hypothetical protein
LEWVKVVYPRTRDVFVDGRRSGQTNTVLIVDKGTHRFALGTPVDYKPARRDVPVMATSVLAPLEIEFTPVGAAPA